MVNDALDKLLADVAPTTSADLTESDVRAIVRGTRREAHGRTHRAGRVALIAGLTVALAGGGTAAALANDDLRDWFFSGMQDPYVTVQYTVPSGAVCTETFGDTISNDPAASEALRDWLTSADVMSLVDIDEALSQVRSYDEYDQSQTGSDAEFQMAVGIAIVLAAREELTAQGFAPGAIDQWKSEGECAEPGR